MAEIMPDLEAEHESTDYQWQRSEEDVENKVILAKLKPEELKPFVQSLSLSDKLNDDNISLMELDSALLEHVLSGKTFCIRGEEKDSAVVCTESKTYGIKEAETSNSCLLCPQWTWPEKIQGTDSTKGRSITYRKVVGIYHTYYELKLCRPQLKNLRQLLESNPYQGKEYEEGNDAKKYTLEDLYEVVPASEAEIKSGLDHLEAYHINGHIRLLDFDYKYRVLSFILNLIDSNSWPFNKVPKNAVLDTLQDLEPREIIEQCLHQYAYYTGEKNEEGDEIFVLNEDKVCQFYAEVLLRPIGTFNLEEFLMSWQGSVPEGMVTNLEQLKGLALTNLDARPQVISFYPALDLPDDPAERFNSLFKTREKWTQAEIRPYIQDLATEKTDINGLLTRYARASVKDGVTLYSSKNKI